MMYLLFLAILYKLHGGRFVCFILSAFGVDVEDDKTPEAPPAAAPDDASGTARGGGGQTEDLPLVSKYDLDVGEGGGDGGGTFAGDYHQYHRLETEGDDEEQQQGNADELRNTYTRGFSVTISDLSGGVGAPIGLSDLTTLARGRSDGDTTLIGKKNHWFLSVKDRNILKRRTIMDRVTPLLLLSSFVADLDLVTDWCFFHYGLVGQGLVLRRIALGFAIMGTVMWVLCSTEFVPLSSLKNMCKGSPLGRLQPVSLGWQLLANVFLEDLPQFVITIMTGPISVSGVLNLVASGFSLVAEFLHGIMTKRTPSLSTQFKMIDQDPVVTRNLFKLRDEAKQRAKLAEQLIYLAWANRNAAEEEQKAAAVFQVMQIDPTFANGDLDYMKSDLLHGDRLYITGRGLQGPIPQELGTMSAMRAIVLRDNELSGTISPQLGKLEALMEIDLASNRLSGTIPTEFGLLSSLRILHLQNNSLTGSIPPQLGALGSLTSLVLAGNELTGTIPVELAELGELGKLDLSSNKLTAKSPAVRGHRPPPVRWRRNVSWARRLPAVQTPPTDRYVATPTSSPPVSPGIAAVVSWPSPKFNYDEQLSSRPGAWGTHRLALPSQPLQWPPPMPPLQLQTQVDRPPPSPTQRGRLHCRSPLTPLQLQTQAHFAPPSPTQRGKLHCRSPWPPLQLQTQAHLPPSSPTQRGTPLPITVVAAGATASAAAFTTALSPHVGTSPTKDARDGGYGPGGSRKTHCSGLPDLTFIFLETARLIAFASPQPSPDAVTTLACNHMGISLTVVA